mgnify:CR=1 FL=1
MAVARRTEPVAERQAGAAVAGRPLLPAEATDDDVAGAIGILVPSLRNAR